MLLSLKITMAIGAGMIAALPLALPCGTCGAPLPGEPELVTIAPRVSSIARPGNSRAAGGPSTRPLFQAQENPAHADAAAGYGGRVRRVRAGRWLPRVAAG